MVTTYAHGVEIIREETVGKRRVKGLKVDNLKTLTLLACGRTISEAADSRGDSEEGQKLAEFSRLRQVS